MVENDDGHSTTLSGDMTANNREYPMNLKIIERPAQTVIGMSIRTMPMSPEIPALWPKFVTRIPEIENPSEPRVSYGVMRDEGDALNYTAAVSVAAAGRVPQGMESVSIPAATYAAFRYPLSELGKGFDEIFNRLLPSSDFVQASGTLLERYDESFDPTNPNSAVEICIPVRRK
jgi:AraC family transcriptional regulator